MITGSQTLFAEKSGEVRSDVSKYRFYSKFIAGAQVEYLLLQDGLASYLSPSSDALVKSGISGRE